MLIVLLSARTGASWHTNINRMLCDRLDTINKERWKNFLETERERLFGSPWAILSVADRFEMSVSHDRTRSCRIA
jgi:hypothetical protein